METHRKERKDATKFEELQHLFNEESLTNAIMFDGMNAFFRVHDHETATRDGTIYDPSSNDSHNWGVNRRMDGSTRRSKHAHHHLISALT